MIIIIIIIIIIIYSPFSSYCRSVGTLERVISSKKSYSRLPQFQSSFFGNES